MIIDVHYHYMRLPAKEGAACIMVNDLLEDAARTGVKKSYDETIRLYRDYLNDVNCDKLVKRMDANGVEITVICVVDNCEYGLSTDYMMRVNESCARAAARHPGRLLSLAGIDPRRKDAPALFRRCLADFKMNGLKWHPDHGYYPNSKEAYSVLEVANEFGVPLLTHCSPLPRSRAKYSHPIHLDDVALDFPNVNIIAAHMGHLWWHEWAALAQYKKNITGDMAMWQLTAMSKPAIFRRYLREILDVIGPEQVLWATDGPCFEPLVPNKKWVEIMKGLTQKSKDGIIFSPDEVDALLGNNAARIFKLNKE